MLYLTACLCYKKTTPLQSRVAFRFLCILISIIIIIALCCFFKQQQQQLFSFLFYQITLLSIWIQSKQAKCPVASWSASFCFLLPLLLLPLLLLLLLLFLLAFISYYIVRMQSTFRGGPISQQVRLLQLKLLLKVAKSPLSINIYEKC